MSKPSDKAMQDLKPLYKRLQQKMPHLTLEQVKALYTPDAPSGAYALVMQASSWDEGELPIQLYAEYHTAEAIVPYKQALDEAEKALRLCMWDNRDINREIAQNALATIAKLTTNEKIDV